MNNCYCGHPKERHRTIGADIQKGFERFTGSCKHCVCSEYATQEPKALEEKPCCVAELGCLCPDEDGMSEHDSEKCPCPEHYAKHEEWLRNLIAMAKPQEAYGFRDHRHCPEKDSPCGMKGKHPCCLCGTKPQEEPCKECHYPKGEPHSRRCSMRRDGLVGETEPAIDFDHTTKENVEWPCIHKDAIILPRPKGWRIGQTIWNFKEWLRLTHEVKDFFYMTDDEWNRRWNEYLTSIKSQE